MTEDEMKTAIDKAFNKVYPIIVRDSYNLKTSNEFREEILQISIEYFFGLDIERQYKIAITDDALLNYIMRGASVQLKSSTSKFWQQHRKFRYNSRVLLPIEKSIADTLSDLEIDKKLYKAIDQLEWYEQELIKMVYFEGITITEIKRETKCSEHWIKYTLNTAIHKLYDTLKDE